MSPAKMYLVYLAITENPVDRKTFNKVSEAWGNRVAEYLVEGKAVRMYNRMGILCIKKEEVIKYKHSIKGGKSVNSHSDFMLARLNWKTMYAMQNRHSTWVFKTGRQLKGMIYDVMVQPGGHRRYIKLAKTGKKDYNPILHAKQYRW